MVHFVGAGCGAADLITLRGKALLETADVILYAGSLVNPKLLAYAKRGCELYDSAKMTLEEIIAVIQRAESLKRTTVRLHSGDPSLYGAICEQMRVLDALGIGYDICPGVSALCGAAGGVYAARGFSNGFDYPCRRENAGARTGKHSFARRAWRGDGTFFECRLAFGGVARADRGRIRARHARRYRL